MITPYVSRKLFIYLHAGIKSVLLISLCASLGIRIGIRKEKMVLEHLWCRVGAFSKDILIPLVNKYLSISHQNTGFICTFVNRSRKQQFRLRGCINLLF